MIPNFLFDYALQESGTSCLFSATRVLHHKIKPKIKWNSSLVGSVSFSNLIRLQRLLLKFLQNILENAEVTVVSLGKQKLSLTGETNINIFFCPSFKFKNSWRSDCSRKESYYKCWLCAWNFGRHRSAMRLLYYIFFIVFLTSLSGFYFIH